MDDTTQKGVLHYLTKITEQLAWLDSWIKLAAGAGRTDINVVSETIMGGLLNRMYGWDLKNTNTPKPNFPGIDLADEDRCIGVQVTSKNKLEKVNETLEKFKTNNLDKRFDKLIILLVTNDNPTPGMTKAELKPWFVGSEDIWNMKRLVRELQSWEDVDRLKEIATYLEKQLGSLPGMRDKKQYRPPKEEEEESSSDLKKEKTGRTFLGLDCDEIASTFSRPGVQLALVLLVVMLAMAIVGSLLPLQEMPEALADYSVTLNGSTVSVPTTFQRMEELGWICEEEGILEERIAPNTYTRSSFADLKMDLTNGHGEILVYYCNPSNHTLTVEECIIYRLQITKYAYDNSYTGESVNTLQAPYDLVLGESKRGEFTSTVGSDKQKTSSTITYSFELDDSHCYKLKFNRDSKLFEGVEIINADTEQFRELIGAEYFAEAPEYDAAALQAYLGTEITLSVGEYDYPIDRTVEEYALLGYMVDKTPEFVVSCDHGDVYIRGDAVNKISAEAYNPFRCALVSRYCFIGCLSTEDIESASTDFSLRCTVGENELTIAAGISEQALKTELTEQGIEWINDGSNSVTFCPNADNKEVAVTCQFNGEERVLSGISVDTCKALQTYFLNLGL